MPASRNSKAIYFNIASLFVNSDITVIPEQFLDSAKNSLEKWSVKDDSKLMKAFQRYEHNWQKIQDEMKTTKKSADDCKDRMERLQNSVKGAWSLEEDALIIKFVGKFGRNWAQIAKKIEGRSGK